MKGSRIWTVVFVLVIPYIAIVAAFPWYNRAEPFIFGVPFVYAWYYAWFFLTSLCMFIGWRIDPVSIRARAYKKAQQQEGK